METKHNRNAEEINNMKKELERLERGYTLGNTQSNIPETIELENAGS